MELKKTGFVVAAVFTTLLSGAANAGWYCQTNEGSYPMPNAIPQQGLYCSGQSAYGNYMIGGSTVWINDNGGYRGGYQGGYRGNQGGGLSHQRQQDIQKALTCGADPYCWGATTIIQELEEGDLIENTVDNIGRAVEDVGDLFGF